MKLSEMFGKEIVNLFDGARLGTIGDSDLIIDGINGKIESIVVPGKGNIMGFWSDKRQLIIPWEAVKKIGSEIIIVDLDQADEKNRNLT